MVEIEDLSNFFRERCPEFLFESPEDIATMMHSVVNAFTSDAQAANITIFKTANGNGQLNIIKEPVQRGGTYLFGVKDNMSIAGYKYTIVYKNLMANKPSENFVEIFNDLRLLSYWIVEAVKLHHEPHGE